MRSAYTTPRAVTLCAALLLLLGLVGVLALGLGTVATPAREVVQVLLGHGEALTRQLVLELRAPRIVLAMLSGAMFATSGAILQGVIRNPLAAPDLIGIGAGAGLAATVYLLLGSTGSIGTNIGLPWVAFGGAWLGFGLVLLLAYSRAGGLQPVRLALVGVAVAAGLNAAQRLIVVRAPDGLGAVLSFLSGTVYGADWLRVERVLPWAGLLLVAWLQSRTLDVLNLGDDLATSLGVRLNLQRLLCLAVAVALAAAAVSGVGVLGFVGLLAPHLSRLLVGGKHARLLPTSALLGALLVLGADTLGRNILPPFEVPAGVLTTLLGAPYFLYLLRRTR